MKRFPIVCTLLLAGLLFAMPASSQVKVGFGFIGGIPVGDLGNFTNFGAGLYLEGKYGVTDNIEAGAQLGVLGFIGTDFLGTSVGGVTMIPFLITGDYKFASSKATPYAGLGIGPYFVSGGSVGTSGIDVYSGAEFGLAPRFGVYLGKLNLGLTYHIVSNASFLGIHLGFLFGGG